MQVEQRAEALFQEGMALFDRGQLQPSLLKFEVGTVADRRRSEQGSAFGMP